MRISLDLSKDNLEKYTKIFTSIIHRNNFELIYEIKENELEEISEYIKSNKFNFTSLSPPARSVVKDSNLKVIYQQQQQRQNYILTSFSEIKRQFTDQGICYVFIKSPGYFPLFSDNLDIIINPAHATKTKKILEDNSYFELFKWSEPFKAYYRKYAGTREVLSVHLHEKVAWDGKIFLDHENCFDDKQEMKNLPGFYMPGAENSFLITLSHALFENKYILLGDYQKLIYIKNNFNLNINRINEIVEQYYWSEGFSYIIKTIVGFEKSLNINNGISNLFSTKQRLNKAEKCLPITIGKVKSRVMFIKSMLADSKISIIKRILWTFGMVSLAIKRKLRITIQSYFKFRQTSFIISFSGQDNSGKTTLIHSINKIFKECDFDYVNIWSRIGSSSSFLQVLTKTFNRIKGEYNLSEVEDYDRRNRRFNYLRKNKLLKCLWLFFSIFDYTIRMNSLIFYYKIRGKVIFLDRYYFDAIEEIEHVSKKTILKKIISWMIIFKPDISFYLIDDSLVDSKFQVNIDVLSIIVKKMNGIDNNVDFCNKIITKKYFIKKKIRHLIAGELNKSS